MRSAGSYRRSPTAGLRHRSRGLTLIELMITLAVLVVLLTLAAPSFRTLLMNSRIGTQSDAFFNGLNYARSTALNTSVQVDVCPVGTNDADSTCGVDWGAGWMVLGHPADSATPVILQSMRPSEGGPVLASVSVGGNPASAVVSFSPRGLATNQAYFRICDTRGSDYARSLTVTPTGFVQAGPTPGQAVWGGALSCPASIQSR